MPLIRENGKGVDVRKPTKNDFLQKIWKTLGKIEAGVWGVWVAISIVNIIER